MFHFVIRYIHMAENGQFIIFCPKLQESGEQFFCQMNCISFYCMHKELLY